MIIHYQYRRSFFVMTCIALLVLVLIQCSGTNKEKVKQTVWDDVAFADFAGSAACAPCHQKIHNSHLLTAHERTGQPVTDSNILGSFKPPANTYNYSPQIQLQMQQRDSGFYQVAFFKGEEKKAMRFDWVIGSGVMGQSFLTWRNNKLYQLPITYFTAANAWSNSPGFPTNKVMIDRPVTARCLECHITYAKGMGGTELEPETFDPKQVLYGVGCEKCHGPGKAHISYHEQHPADSVAQYIVNPSKLSRQQQLDICALCHGGNLEKTKPSFLFTAGKNLPDYFKMTTTNETAVQTGNVDVHGNQYALFTASKCFKMSADLTCNTCHNTHENERGKLALFSQRCMNCHNTGSEKMKTVTHTQAASLQQNCIDCHMPAQPSQSIAVFLAGEETPRASLLRSHFIGVYPEVSKAFNLRKNKTAQ
jgi:hypothetical protein